MLAPDNPYESPQSTPEQSSGFRQPQSPAADNSIFNLDAAALGLMIVSSVEALMLAQFAAAALLDRLNSPLAGAPLLRYHIAGMVATALSLRSAAIMAIAYFCMHRRRYYWLALLGAFLPLFGVLSWPICYSIPFGIWAFIRLLRKDTRNTFSQTSHLH